MSKDKVMNIEIWAHRWDDMHGNTYFRAQVLANDAIVHTDTTNQRGRGWENLYAWKVLIKLGYLPEDAVDAVPSRYCREHNIVFSSHATDGLKRQLAF